MIADVIVLKAVVMVLGAVVVLFVVFGIRRDREELIRVKRRVAIAVDERGNWEMCGGGAKSDKAMLGMIRAQSSYLGNPDVRIVDVTVCDD